MRRPEHAYLRRAHIFGRTLAFGVSLVALGVGVALVVSPMSAFAQSAEDTPFGRPATDPDAQMLLQADRLIYDNDTEVVTAEGKVQIDYNGYNLVAKKVIYNQKTRRIVAIGNVEILEPGGNRIYADTIDVTDDFGEGFLIALRVETPDDTRFVAKSAERLPGQKTVFNRGIYTACKACKDNPEKPPLWQIKARTIVHDGVKKTITYRDARFEFFGLPIAYLPYFTQADPSVKRKSGFLLPSYSMVEKLGYSIRAPYFLVTGPSNDLTIAETWYSRQGFLTDVKWRHQLDNGYYTFKAAAISQNGRSEFTSGPDNTVTLRGMVATTGLFNINPRWNFGWNYLLQSDRTFARTYKISGYQNLFVTNEVFLRGLNDRSFFNLSAYQFLIQNETAAGPTDAPQQNEQARVLPVLDYNYVKSDPVFGGQLAYNVNLAVISRIADATIIPDSGDVRYHGIDGENARVSIDIEWKRTYTSSYGMSLTPSLSFEGNAYFVRPGGVSAAPVVDGDEFRAMPALGLEFRWPILATAGSASHIFEPIAQIFARPSIQSASTLPNEDSQSLVFDTTNLFERNKYSGYDRLEGGVRANLGLRYSGLFNNGANISALFGQSFQLAGNNPYAREDDLVNVGEESGLESARSDYVAMVGFATSNGLYLEARGRFDENDFSVRRFETTALYTSSRYTLGASYAFIGSQPDYGFAENRAQATIVGSIKLTEFWRAFGAAQYDVKNGQLINDSFGISYNDECFSFSLSFSENRDRYSSDVSNRKVMLRIGFRTIGDIETSQDVDDFNF